MQTYSYFNTKQTTYFQWSHITLRHSCVYVAALCAHCVWWMCVCMKCENALTRMKCIHLTNAYSYFEIIIISFVWQQRKSGKKIHVHIFLYTRLIVHRIKQKLENRLEISPSVRWMLCIRNQCQWMKDKRNNDVMRKKKSESVKKYGLWQKNREKYVISNWKWRKATLITVHNMCSFISYNFEN